MATKLNNHPHYHTNVTLVVLAQRPHLSCFDETSHLRFIGFRRASLHDRIANAFDASLMMLSSFGMNRMIDVAKIVSKHDPNSLFGPVIVDTHDKLRTIAHRAGYKTGQRVTRCLRR